MIKGDKIEIVVDVHKKSLEDGHTVFIRVPKEQDELTISDICHLLVSGIGALIKSSPKDFNLMEEVIEHLNQEFAYAESNTLFIDETLLKNEKNKNNDKPETKE